MPSRPPRLEHQVTDQDTLPLMERRTTRGRAQEVEGASDRVMAILAAAALDDNLGALVQASLCEGSEREEALEPDGIFGPYMSRVRAASLLGLVGPDIRDDLIQIGRVRNLFAHQHRRISSEDPAIVKHCRKLRTPEKWSQAPVSGGQPGDGLMVAGLDNLGNLKSISISVFERDNLLTDSRWRYEAAVQMISYVLARVRKPAALPAAL